MKIKFKKMRPGAIIPAFGHGDPSNAGLDFYSCLPEGQDRLLVMPGKLEVVGTGVAWEPVGPIVLETRDTMQDDPSIIRIHTTELSGWKPALLVRGRSGVARQGVSVAEGTVDSNYRGEIMITLRNESDRCFVIEPGDRIAQGVTILIPEVEIIESEELSDTSRGDKGFGSSGK